jgi:hypothetical protein
MACLIPICLAAPLLTPWQLDTYRYVIELASAPATGQITEWAPLLTRWPAGALFALATLLGIVVAIRRSTRRPTLEEVLVLATFSGLALWSGRAVLWWALAVPPMYVGMLRGWEPGTVWSRTSKRVAVGTAVFLVALGTLKVAAVPASTLLSEAPPGITAWLQANDDRPGHVLTEHWGGWFEFSVPQTPMFVDSRLEMFPDAIWGDYLQMVNVLPGWGSTLDRWQIDTVVVGAGRQPEFVAALLGAGWVVAYEDVDGVVLTRSSTGTVQAP